MTAPSAARATTTCAHGPTRPATAPPMASTALLADMECVTAEMPDSATTTSFTNNVICQSVSRSPKLTSNRFHTPVATSTP